MAYILAMPKPQLSRTGETLRRNVKALMAQTDMTVAELSKKSRISPRMISYILSGERGATVDTAERLAKAFGLRGWQLLLPDIPTEILCSLALEKLYRSYIKASEEGRELIERVCDRESKYGSKN